MKRLLPILVLLWLAAIHAAFAIAVFASSGCQHRHRHVDYRLVPPEPAEVHRLPSWRQEPRRAVEREA